MRPSTKDSREGSVVKTYVVPKGGLFSLVTCPVRKTHTNQKDGKGKFRYESKEVECLSLHLMNCVLQHYFFEVVAWIGAGVWSEHATPVMVAVAMMSCKLSFSDIHAHKCAWLLTKYPKLRLMSRPMLQIWQEGPKPRPNGTIKRILGTLPTENT